MRTVTCPDCQTVYQYPDRTTVCCEECDLTCSGYFGNDRSSWMATPDYHDSCRSLQDQMDAAFDNQYFDGGW